MGGSSKQTIGYKYFAGLMVVIGNPIEKFLGINADNRGWIAHKDNDNQDESLMVINNPNLFGGSNQEGGWVGVVDIHHGKDTQEQNQYLAKNIDPDISAYPNLSYLVFRGYDSATQSENLNKGFEVVSMSGMLKDFMLWVKRTRIKNDGNRQWYEINGKGDIVCEIDAISSSGIVTPKDEFNATALTQSTDISNGSILNTNINSNIIMISDEGDYKFYNWINWKDGLDEGFSDEKGMGYIFSGKITLNTGGRALFKFRINLGVSNDGFIFSTNGSIIKQEHKQEETYYSHIYEIEVIAESQISLNIDISKTTESNSLLFVQHDSLYFELRSYSNYNQIDAKDINPIHKIREIITDYTAMNKPESLINDDNFKKMADIIYDERLGISWCIQEKSCKDALDELLYHIEAGLRINRQTGLYEVILFRDDLINLDGSLIFNESNIKSINFDIANLDESISSINISYYDRELIKDSSFILYENGLERTRGFSISENIDFPYFMNRRNAELVGNWKLKQLSSSTWKGSFKTGIIEARKINKYDVIKLNWKSKGLVDLPVRILNINLGDGINNTVTLDFIEVIPYSNIDYTSTNVDPPIDENMSPQFNSNIAIEMPYFEAVQRFTQTQVDLELSNSPELGYLIASAARPQNNSLNAQLFTDKGTGTYANMSKASVVDYCPAVYLDGEIGYLDDVLKITNLDAVSINKVPAFSGATKGTWILLNDEIMVYESFDSEAMEITVKRGALDTIPQKHESGIIFFSDEFSGADQTQYIQGEIVQYQVLTTTPSSIRGLELGDSKFTEFNSRAIRPYPPANIKINGEYYTKVIDSDLIITWANRNRIQQTGGNIIGWFDGDITVEQNVLIKIDFDFILNDGSIISSISQNASGNQFILDLSEIPQETSSIYIKISSIRDGYESLQVFSHNVNISTVLTAPYNIEYTVSDI